MEHLRNLDIQTITSVSVLFIFAFMLGRITKTTRAINNYNQTLASLNKKIQSAAEKRSKYNSYQFTLKNISKLLIFLYCACGFLFFYLKISFAINYVQYFICISVGLLAFCLSLAYACNLISQDYMKKQEMYKEQVTSSKSEIIKDLGPEVMEILQGAECNKKCKESTEKLNRTLKKHQELIQNFAKFQWCDACSQGKKCTGMCGSSFWVYTKEALKDFRGVS